MINILLTLIITAMACSLIGVFLVVRNLSMVTDAISHSAMLGIILAYFIVKDVASPFMIIGAGIFGILTVAGIDLLGKVGLIKNDAATGIIFSLFFSIGIILISKFARNVHICTDTVLMGEIIYAPLNSMNILGIYLPKSFLIMSIILLINLIFIIIFYKELKISSFDKELSIIAGFSISIIYYMLMSLVAITAVGAFETVGAILVIAFFIIPGASAYLLTNKLHYMLIIAVIYSIFASILSYILALILNVNISGMCATILGVLFILTLIFNKNGIITKAIVRVSNRKKFYLECIILHIGNHNDNEENGVHSIYNHINWKKKKLNKYIKYLFVKKLLIIKDDRYFLTDKGISYYEKLKSDYNLW